MPSGRFTRNIQRHLPCPERAVRGGTVREALDAYFAAEPRARGYVLDEHGSLRKHMAVFVDGAQISDRVGLSERVPEEGVIDVFQALSGG